MLLEKLKLKQGELSDYQFANKLGISHQLWQMTRTGKREISSVILRATTRVYPELDQDVLIFLRGDVVSPSVIGGLTADAHQTSQDKLWRALRGVAKVFSLGFYKGGDSKANKSLRAKSERG